MEKLETKISYWKSAFTGNIVVTEYQKQKAIKIGKFIYTQIKAKNNEQN